MEWFENRDHFSWPSWLMILYGSSLDKIYVAYISWGLAALLLLKDLFIRNVVRSIINWSMIGIFLVFVVLPYFLVELDFKGWVAEQKRDRLVFLEGRQRTNFDIRRMSQSEMLEALYDESLPLPHKAKIIDELSMYPGEETIKAVTSFLGDDRKVMVDHYMPPPGEWKLGEVGGWFLGPMTLGGVAKHTLKKIAGEEFSSSDEWNSWFETTQEN